MKTPMTKAIFLNILENIPAIVAFHDTQQRIVWANQAFREATGKSLDEVVEKECFLAWGLERLCRNCPVTTALLTGKPAEEELTPKNQDHWPESQGCWLTKASPIRGPDGQIIGVVETAFAVTESKKAEHQKITESEDRYRGVFEQAEKDKEKLHNQLLQAQKLESVGRLAGGVAHDLNNMLVAILGYGDMLLADPELESKHKKRVERMHQAGLRCKALVSQLLAFSRKQTLQFGTLHINNVLTEFHTLLHRTIRENIEMEFLLSPDLPPIKADRIQLEQVILNLAVNAQDTMPEGGKLTIETQVADLDENYVAQHIGVIPGRYVLLMISDTGQGMDKEILDHIFEPFFTTKTKDKGTGLGLAMVYGIVKQHHGDIWVYSEPGKGTTFKIYLPALDANSQLEQPAAPIAQKKAHGHETVCVVEDDDIVRELAVNVLQEQGYRVLWAANGSQCLDLIRSHSGPFDLLLTDVVMPDMNGKALYEKVLQSLPRVRVLYMSGYTENIICHHGVLDEGVAFIQKPFSAQDLGNKVREALDQEEQ